jgi:hypothetical protein
MKARMRHQLGPDIVTRLRGGAGDAALCEEAAAEIERLRSLVDDLWASNGRWLEWAAFKAREAACEFERGVVK